MNLSGDQAFTNTVFVTKIKTPKQLLSFDAVFHLLSYFV